MEDILLYKILGLIIFLPGLLLVIVSKAILFYSFGFVLMLMAGFLILEGNPRLKQHILKKK